MAGTVKSGPDYSKITEKGILGTFRLMLEDLIGSGWADQVGMRVESDQERETYRWLGMTPALREWVGARLAKGIRIEEYVLANKIFEVTLPIPVDDLRREKISQLRIRIGDIATRVFEHWEKLLSEAIETNGLCYDGQNFFDTDHVSGSSGTHKNALTASDTSEGFAVLNVTTAAAPTREEMIAIILQAIQHFYTFKDDQGEPANGGARRFLVMVPVNMYAAAVGAVTDALTVSGGSNTLINQRFQVTVEPNPRLTSSTVMYVFRTDANAKPFILQSEMDATASVIGAGSEEEFKNRRWLFGAEAIRTVGYGLWQHALKLTLS